MTATKAPDGTLQITEAEMRDLIAERIGRYPRDSGYVALEEAIDQAFDVVGYTSLDPQGRYDFAADFLSDAWADLTRAQLEDLNRLIAAARIRAFTASWNVIAGEIVATALAFAAAHPEAKRAPREAVPA